MTKEQVKFILEDVYQESGDVYTPLLNNMMIVVTKDANLYTDVERWRYKFDLDNKILMQIMVRRVNELTYGMVGENRGTNENPIYYEYITDKRGNIITNYFDFDKIIMFVPNTSKVTASTVNNAIVLSALNGGN